MHYQVLALPQVYVLKYILLYTALNINTCKINNASGTSAESKEVRDVSKGGGSP